MGVQMVSRGRYEQAMAILEAICVGYPFHESFIAGQVCPSSRVRFDKDTPVCARACMAILHTEEHAGTRACFWLFFSYLHRVSLGAPPPVACHKCTRGHGVSNHLCVPQSARAAG